MKKILLSCFTCMLAFGLAQAQTQYYGETFESGAASGWTVEDEWAFGNNASLTSAYLNFNGNDTEFAAFNDDNAGNGHVGGGRITSPSIDLTAVTGPLILEANVFFSNADYQGADETLKLFVSTDAGANWELVEDYAAEAWTRKVYDFAAYAGQTIMLSFEYLDGNQWNFGAAIDDIGLSDDLVFTPRKAYTLTVDGGSQFSQCAENVDYPISGVVLNTGFDNITSFDINVTSAGTTTTYPFTGDFASNEVFRYSIPDMINTGTVASTHTVSITNVNGEADEDENTADNFANIAFAPVAVAAGKGVLVEEATGTWCTWCPRGTVYIDEMSKRFGKSFVGVAVHNNDPMALAEYDAAITGFNGFTGFPSVVYGRDRILDPSEITGPTIVDLISPAIANIAVGAEENGGVLSTSAKVTFNQAVTANHNVSIILTEDGVTGTGTGWNQVSGAYSGGGQGPMGGFEYFPTSVPSEWWPYGHVGRALIGGYAGLNGVVGDFEVGSAPSVYFEDFTMDASWNTDNMHIIAVLTDAAGRVVNVVSEKYNDAIAAGNVVSIEEILPADFVKLYPNPADNIANIAINLENSSRVVADVVDNLGRKVASQNFGDIQGVNTLRLDVSNLTTGSYIVQLRVKDKLVIKKLSVR